MVRSALLLSLAVALSAQTPPAPRTVSGLKAFYQENCVKCHGLDGSATDLQGQRLKGRDFTSAKDMQGSTDAALVKILRKGIFFGLGMPAFKAELSEEESLLLVREVLRKAVKGQPIAPQVDPRPLVPESIKDQKKIDR